MRRSPASSAASWARCAPASTTANAPCGTCWKGNTIMSEKDLGKALLQLNSLDLAGVGNARQQTWQVLERDRRRVRLWTGVTVGLWLLAMLWVVFVLVTFGLLMPMQAKLLQDPDKADERFKDDPEKAKAAARMREPVVMNLILQK